MVVASPIIEVTVDRLVIGVMEAVEVGLVERVPEAEPLIGPVAVPVVPRVTDAGGSSVYATQVSFSYSAASRVQGRQAVNVYTECTHCR